MKRSAALLVLLGVTFFWCKPGMSNSVFPISPGDIKKCLQETPLPYPNPDALSNARTWLRSMDPSGLAAIAEISFFDSGTTNREANHGIVSYMAASVVSDADLFSTSLSFYQILQELDLRTNRVQMPLEEGPSSINDRAATDLYPYAFELSGAHPYRALKTLALYGHDNFQNSLRAKSHVRHCRINVLEDTVAPTSQSNLYLNGALAHIQYDPELVEDASAIARDCQESTSYHPLLWNLCNDRYLEYQADYYHVIASAFLNCRRIIAQNIYWNNPERTSALPLENTVERTYLNQVRKYKIARFREEIAFLSENPPADLPSAPKIQALLFQQLERIEKGEGFLLPGSHEQWDLSPADFEAVKSILRRYEFEISFRIYQHQLGLRFAKKECRGLTDFGISRE